MATYEIKEPPNAEQCNTHACIQTATVRVIIPREMLPDACDSLTEDQCCICWPKLRRNLTERGHEIRDITGDPDCLAAEYPGSTVFRSDEGILYASLPVPGTPQRTTLDAYLVGHLRAQVDLATQQVKA
jgi:hypothetical protein